VDHAAFAFVLDSGLPLGFAFERELEEQVRLVAVSAKGAGKLLTKYQNPATLAAFFVDSMFFFLFIASPDMGHRATTGSSVVALLRSHQCPAFALLRLQGD
jgi:hypothetical protein